MLESLGALTIVFVFLYAFYLYLLNSREKKIKREENIKHSRTTQSLIYKYNNSVQIGNPIMTEVEFRKTLKNYLNDDRIKEEIQNSKERKVKRDKAYKEWETVGKELSNIYAINIFKTFYDNRELSESKIIKGITNELLIVNKEQSIEVLNKWVKYGLLKKCLWNNKYAIGTVLSSKQFDEEKNDFLPLKKRLLAFRKYACIKTC